MGVPGFFVYILKNQQLKESIVYQNINKDIDILYFDFNCLIHLCAAKVRSENDNWKSITQLENLIHDEVISYTKHVIEFVNPNYGVFIAIDGVCPMGKIIQQRDRRYRTVIEIDELNKLKKKFDVDIDKYWCTSKISPCTSFMMTLEKKILKQIKNKYKHLHIWLSTSSTPGEGEHKIIHHIKSLNNKNNNIVIYGLDADLIFLSLSLQHQNILLLRESQKVDHKAKDSEFTWIDMEIFKKEIMIKMNSNTQNAITDFIFLCFLLKNDFIPNIPTVNIYKNAIPFLIFEYNKHKKNNSNKFLVYHTNLDINIHFFKEILHSISVRESFTLQKQFIEYRDRTLNKTFDNEYEKQLFIYNRVLDHKDDLQLKGINILEDKKKYYSRFFYPQKNVQNIVHDYLKIIKWCLHYYLQNILSWNYHYPFHHAPFASDILQVLKSQTISLKYQFTLHKPLKPIEQLVLIIPIKDKNIIPKQFHSIYKIKDFYKYFHFKKFIKYDNNYVQQRYLTKTLLPTINMQIYQQEIDNIIQHLQPKDKKKIELMQSTQIYYFPAKI